MRSESLSPVQPKMHGRIHVSCIRLDVNQPLAMVFTQFMVKDLSSVEYKANVREKSKLSKEAQGKDAITPKRLTNSFSIGFRKDLATKAW